MDQRPQVISVGDLRVGDTVKERNGVECLVSGLVPVDTHRLDVTLISLNRSGLPLAKTFALTNETAVVRTKLGSDPGHWIHLLKTIHPGDAVTVTSSDDYYRLAGAEVVVHSVSDEWLTVEYGRQPHYVRRSEVLPSETVRMLKVEAQASLDALRHQPLDLRIPEHAREMYRRLGLRHVELGGKTYGLAHESDYKTNEGRSYRLVHEDRIVAEVDAVDDYGSTARRIERFAIAIEHRTPEVVAFLAEHVTGYWLEKPGASIKPESHGGLGHDFWAGVVGLEGLHADTDLLESDFVSGNDAAWQGSSGASMFRYWADALTIDITDPAIITPDWAGECWFPGWGPAWQVANGQIEPQLVDRGLDATSSALSL